ncbi:hypothetical protein BD779DRAFT_658754 [Infundibulicybe gibba]|nr:hypothetical protein BD779DRAFT_658754 [Infundibulicybe gibba]
MTTRRLNTIYDYSGLRLHRDGARVQQSSQNHRSRTARSSIRDARGNWVARDAGGSSTIGGIKQVVEESEGEEFDTADMDGSSPPRAAESMGITKNNIRKPHKPDGRTSKRRKFAHNLDFLEASVPAQSIPPHGVLEQPSDGDFMFLPPSSDLLKSIHHYATVYYTSRNQLSNGSREYRKQQKERKLQKLGGHNSKQVTPEDDMGSDASASVDMDTPTEKRRTQGRKKKTEVKDHPIDMYRVMDGSALMAIGMLLQEHIAHLLEPHIADRWRDPHKLIVLDPEGTTKPDNEGEGQLHEVDQ